MKIYIAGKISGLNREDVIKKFEAAQKSLVEKGHQVFIPSVLPAYEEVSHEDYLHICYAIIDVCDAVYLLSDWKKSKGAILEFDYAQQNKKKIIYQAPVNLYNMFINKDFPEKIQNKLENAYKNARTKEEGLFKAGFLAAMAKKQYKDEQL